MISARPLLSIITPSLNRARYVADAIESVVDQGLDDFEHIIVDGGSTDGSLDLIGRYRHLQVVSESDAGMYAALNKGLSLARGRWIGFLNTDDRYPRGAFKALIPYLSVDDGPAALSGGGVVCEGGEHEARQVVGEYHPEPAGLAQAATVGSPFFNCWFFRAAVFEELGGFDPRYKIVADREFMIRFALSGLPYQVIPEVVYEYLQHPGSLTFDLTDEKMARITDEHLMMTGIFLRRDLSREMKRLIRARCTMDTLEMFIRRLRRGQVVSGLKYAWAGVRCDPRWGPALVSRMIAKMTRQVA